MSWNDKYTKNNVDWNQYLVSYKMIPCISPNQNQNQMIVNLLFWVTTVIYLIDVWGHQVWLGVVYTFVNLTIFEQLRWTVLQNGVETGWLSLNLSLQENVTERVGEPWTFISDEKLMYFEIAKLWSFSI